MAVLYLGNRIISYMSFTPGEGGAEPVIPSQYIQVPYITSDGGQWIDTGVVLRGDSKVELRVAGTSMGNTTMLFGARVAVRDNAFCIFASYQNKLRWDYRLAEDTTDYIGTLTGSPDTLVFDAGKVYLNNNQLASVPHKNIDTRYSAYLCTINTAGSPDAAGVNKFSGQIYGTKIWQDGSTLDRDLVPVYDTESGAYGMWDTVSQSFYANQGSGNFSGPQATN